MDERPPAKVGIASSGWRREGRAASARSERIDQPASGQVPRLDGERRPALPTPFTSLIGRDQELATLRRILLRPDHAIEAASVPRLVTLTGPGGVGKTRLALAIAAELADTFADGVAFVDLAPLTDPDLVLPTVAGALGVRETGDRPLADRLTALLRDGALLLVLDNFERVVEAAPAVAALLAGCPRLVVLATSRIRLGLAGERMMPVPPLDMPDRSAPATVDDLAGNAAVRLFVERAQAVAPAYELTDRDASIVAEVCRRLDGLPLAIELAAARVRVLSPAALLAWLERRLPLLTGGPRDAPARLRTMRGAIAWSHDLLSAEEQALFRRLAVFPGGFTIPAAEAVANPAGDLGLSVLDGIAGLVEASLLGRGAPSAPGGSPEPRYAMLETVREFGQAALAAEGEEDQIRERHAAWCRDLAEQAWPSFGWTGQELWFDRLEAEHDNLRAALDWTIAHDPGTALQLAGALS